jgi:prefoldin subunit 5
MAERELTIMPDEVAEIRQSLAALGKTMGEVQVQISEIKTLVETEPARCIYREKIDSAWQAVARIFKLEERLVQLEVKVAGIAVISALITAVITSLIVGALKP